jgi:hypothetical protein
MNIVEISFFLVLSSFHSPVDIKSPEGGENAALLNSSALASVGQAQKKLGKLLSSFFLSHSREEWAGPLLGERPQNGL